MLVRFSVSPFAVTVAIRKRREVVSSATPVMIFRGNRQRRLCDGEFKRPTVSLADFCRMILSEPAIRQIIGKSNKNAGLTVKVDRG